jgi:hypothetical protein
MNRDITPHSLRRAAPVLPAVIAAIALYAGQADADNRSARNTAAVKEAAAKIDSLVESALQAQGLKPNALADDATFLRRTYLALVGRIPTEAEVTAFKKASSTEKRRHLVDELLASKGHESHTFNWWADLLRARGRLANRASGEPYIHWLKASIARNKSYDSMVKDLLTATGPLHERGNGATGYLMRDRNMPEDNMSNTIRLFLGSRVECAQCHNHPFDKWTQKQYFEMVAFTGGIRYAKNPRQDPRVKDLSKKAQQKWGRNGVRALRRTLESTYIGIYGSGTGLARLPKDYQYEDAKPMDWTTAHPMFDPPVRIDVNMPSEADLRRRVRGRNKEKKIQRMLKRIRPSDSDTRTVFADWLTSPENPRFSMVIANRMWKRAFGRGLIEPVDDIKDDTVAAAPELMAYLSSLMVELDFDLREFERVLYNTRLWRRQACAPADTPGDVADLRGPVLRRMSAEQAWDSLLTLVVDDIDGRIADPLGPRADQIYQRYDELANATDDEILERAGRLALRYSNPEEFRKQQRAQRTKQQAAMRKKRQKARPLYKELGRARKAGDDDKVREISEKLRAMGLQPPGSRAGRAVRDLQRASDLPSPAPDGHLVRELGQSERELIDEAHRDPTVPQVLALLNSFLEQKLLTNSGATLMRSIHDARGTKAKVKTAFIGVLGRTPNSSERSGWEREVSRGGEQAVRDLVWTLVNSHEFLFIQ